MSRQDANAAFALTSFLYGGNARYIEDLYGRYEADPAAVDGEWRSFFQSLKDDARDVAESARGASWGRPDWPLADGGELAQAPGEWAEAGRAISGKVKMSVTTLSPGKLTAIEQFLKSFFSKNAASAPCRAEPASGVLARPVVGSG